MHVESEVKKAKLKRDCWFVVD